MFKKKSKKEKEEDKKKKKKHEDDEDEDEGKKKKKKKGKKKKKKKFVYPAPEDMKPFFLKVMCRTGKDGLITDVEAVRYKGRYDNPKAKSITMSEHDPKTLAAIAARLTPRSFATNPDKRLPRKTVFVIIFRIGKNKDGNVRVGVKEIRMISEGGKKTLKKKHPDYRRIRKCTSIMPGAFQKIGEFPKIKKSKKKDEDDEE